MFNAVRTEHTGHAIYLIEGAELIVVFSVSILVAVALKHPELVLRTIVLLQALLSLRQLPVQFLHAVCSLLE